MKLFPTIARSVALATLLVASTSHASILYTSTNQSLTTADPTELGRPSRSGTPQQWYSPESYTGKINTTSAYHYRTIAINIGVENYLEVTFDDPNAFLFIVAYQGIFNVANQATGWLGDEGSTGSFPGDTGFFQVVAAPNSIVTLVVNDTLTSNGGLGSPFGIVVQGFLNTDRDELAPVTVPEPSSIALSLAGLLALAAFRRRHARRGGPGAVAVPA
jgi:hypothetical protein